MGPLTERVSGVAGNVDGRSVVVIGLMGSGKTTVASVVAQALRRPLRDSDPDLQATLGINAATLVERQGKQALHEWEAEHVVKGALERPPVVVAAAASTIEQARCRAAMREAFVLWLDAPPDVLAQRFESGEHRPRFGQEIVDLLEEQDERRRPLLAGVADVVIDASASLEDVQRQALQTVGEQV